MSSSLSSFVKDDVFDTLLHIRDKQVVGVLIVEHNVQQILRIADSAIAMKLGKIIYIKQEHSKKRGENEEPDYLWCINRMRIHGIRL